MSDDRPRGTVALLFTDIEGSTRLLDQLGDTAYARLLAAHHAVLRSAFTAWGGWEVDNQGDAFFVVFAGAQEAVLCAVDAQRLLAEQSWPGQVEVRVRMGVHTGPAVLEGERYVGLDVHVAARICAAAAGGQVLVSDSTRALVHGRLPQAVALRDLGEHRLKDLTVPQRLSQLDVVGLRRAFPPPRSLEPVRNVPAQLGTFVGREEELDALPRLLSRARLVTVTGPGGTGKTRLSIQVTSIVAARFRHGVHFVPLAPVEDPSLVASAVARALGLSTDDGRTPRDRVLDHLADKHLLLLLDNVEHVLGAVPFVADLLAAAPQVVVLSTSRTPLRVYGEEEFALQPLAAPDPRADVARIARADSVALFVERARAVAPGFALTARNAADVVEVVRRLDGLPLAIELAAARVKVLPPRALLRALAERMHVLDQPGGSRPSRHQTLDAAVAWSYELLPSRLQRTLNRFSAFAGAADLDRAELVCADGLGEAQASPADVVDDLVALVDHSLLVTAEREGEPVFWMLRTIRAFARTRLAESGEERVVLDRHAHTLLALAQELEPQLVTADAKTHLDRLDDEHDDLRAALRHALASNDLLTALSLVAALWRFWQMRGHLSEGRGAAQQVLDRPGVEQHPEALARALEAAGGMAYWQGDLAAARRWYERGVEVCRRDGDTARLAEALYNLSFTHSVTRSDPAQARACAEESLRLWRRLGDRDGAARTLFALGNAAYFQDDVGTAREAYAECLSLATEGGYLQSWASYMLGLAEQGLGRLSSAFPLYQQACRLFAATGDLSGTVVCLNALADVALEGGNPARAAQLAAAATRLESTSGAGMATFVVEQERRDTLRRLREVEPGAWTDGLSLDLDAAVRLALDAGGQAVGNSPPTCPTSSR